MICIHHNKDLDGFSSGAIVKLKFPDATLIGWDYAEPIPEIPSGEDIVMIDISFPIEEVIALRQRSKSLTLIDHHISFKKEFDAALSHVPFENHGINYVYKDGRAACEIGWEYFFPDIDTPYAITLLGEYDTWRNQDEKRWNNQILPFQYAMRISCTSPDTFPIELFDNDDLLIGDTIDIGKAVLKYQEQGDMLACKRSAFEATISDKKAICLNARAFSSNTMQTVYDPEKHDLMLGFEFTGKKWTVSLRSAKPDIDVSLIAKSRGGGGHKAAAGFECSSFEEIFK